MAKTILEEAIEDTKLLKETAIQNAKNVLVEAISPQIKQFVEAQLGAPMMMPGQVPGQMPGMMQLPEEGMYQEEKKEDELDMLANLGVDGIETNEEGGDEEEADEADEDEEEGEEEEVDEIMIPQEAKECDDEDKEELEEVVELTNEDIKEALAEVLNGMKLQKEATVTKGFGDAVDATIPASGGPGEKGIAGDEKEGNWNEQEVPAAKDWTVKEAAMRKQIATLSEQLNQYKEACTHLKRSLQEVNLFNSKLLYTNKLLHSAELNNKQRISVIEAFDRAQSLREVELVYKSISESLKIAGVLGEGKQVQKTMKGPKASRTTMPSSTVLKESVEKDSKDDFVSRMQELAGLVE